MTKRFPEVHLQRKLHNLISFDLKVPISVFLSGSILACGSVSTIVSFIKTKVIELFFFGNAKYARQYGYNCRVSW